MDCTHSPRIVTCEVCCQRDGEDFMLQIGDCFVHNPECLDEYYKTNTEEKTI